MEHPIHLSMTLWSIEMTIYVPCFNGAYHTQKESLDQIISKPPQLQRIVFDSYGQVAINVKQILVNAYQYLNKFL